MPTRKLTIPPFQLPDGTNPEVSVTIALVDATGRNIQGLITADGNPVMDKVTLLVHQTARTVDLWPQPELEPVISQVSNANQTESFYQVDLINSRTRFRHRLRTQIDSGGDLTWAEFVAGQGPLEGGSLSEWMQHLGNTGIHVPAGGTTGQVLAKVDDTDGNTAWATGGGSGGGHEIHDEGVALPARPVLDFIGAGVTAADGAGKTTVTIPGGLAAGDDAAALGSGAATDGQVLTADGAGNAAWETPSGGGGGVDNPMTKDLDVGTFDIISTAGNNVGFASGVADGVSALAFEFNTTNPLADASAKLLSLSNGGVEKAYFDKDGGLVLDQKGTARGMLRFTNDGNDPVIQTDQFHLTIKNNKTVLFLDGNDDGLITFGSSSTYSIKAQATSTIGSLEFPFSANSHITVQKRNNDDPPRSLTIYGKDAATTASINLVGGDTIVRGGHGASDSAGDAHGGDVIVKGGAGYGTGLAGQVVIGDEDGGRLRSDVTDGASAIAFEFDTANELVTNGAKVLSVKESGVEHFYINHNGVAVFDGKNPANNQANFQINVNGTERFTVAEQKTTIKSTSGIAAYRFGGTSNLASFFFVGCDVTNNSGQLGAILELTAHRHASSGAFRLRGAHDSSGYDAVIDDSEVIAAHARNDAVTNLVGGNLVLAGGAGASGSAGAAHGGNVKINGGQQYGTGNVGNVIMDTLPTSDPGVAGALWNNAGVLNISAG